MEASTLSLADKLAFKEILEKAGHTALDCPMSGTGAQAAVKDLVVYASGDAAAIARLEPAFLGFARKVFDLGAYGNGSKMKFVANHLVAIHNVAAAEAMVLAMKAGLDPRQTVEVIASGAGTSRVFELRAPMMAANSYLPATMRSTTWKKDLTVIGEFASSPRLPHAAVRPRRLAARRHPRHGPRRGGQRRRVRGAGEDGGAGAVARRTRHPGSRGAAEAIRDRNGLRIAARGPGSRCARPG